MLWHFKPPLCVLISSQPRLQADLILATRLLSLFSLPTAASLHQYCPQYTSVFVRISVCLRAHIGTHLYSKTPTVWLTSVASHSQNSMARGLGRWVWVSVTSCVCVCVYKERVRTSFSAQHAQWLLWRSGLWLQGDTAGWDAASGPGRRDVFELEEAAFSVLSVADKHTQRRISDVGCCMAGATGLPQWNW